MRTAKWLIAALTIAQASIASWGLSSSATAGYAQLPRPRVVDSLGVRIVEYDLMPPPSPVTPKFADPFRYTLRGVPAAFVVASTPFIRIGGQRSHVDEEIDPSHSMVSALLLGNGTVVVNDRTQLKFFRANGTLVRAVGRHGRGPGEFTRTREICRKLGDTILVFDYSGAVSLWDSAGRFARAYGRPQGRQVPGSCDRNGYFVLQSPSATESSSDRRGGAAVLPTRLIRPDGSVVRDLGLVPGPDIRGLIGRSPSIIPLEGAVLVCSGLTYELRWVRPNGSVRQITRLARLPLEISMAEARENVELAVPSRATQAERDGLVQRLTSRGFPSRWPAHSAVRVDPLGRVWVADFQSETSWTVFGKDGMLLGRVDIAKLPSLSRARLIDVGQDYFGIAHADGDGSIVISYFRISTAPAPARG